MRGDNVNIFVTIFLDSLFILFPLFSYFLFVINEQNVGKETSDILFDLALCTSLYFILRYDVELMVVKVMFLTIPLLIAYLREKMFSVLIFTVTISLYYHFYLHISLFVVMLELFTYLVVVYFLKRLNKNDTTIISVFAIIKIIFVILGLKHTILYDLQVLKEIIILPFTFYIMAHIIWYLIIKSEKIMSLHMTIKELEREKQLRDSLFKITHEIKNPIAVCKGYLDMFDPNNEDHVRRYIPIVRQEIERTLTLMNDFMNLTKLNVEKRKMDISVLLQDISEVSYLMLKEKKMELISSIIDEEIYIDGDYDRLKQVFINVIKNAMEAIPANKKGIIKLDAKINHNELIITINDNGIGMNKEVLSKIGEAFYTTKKEGTGLGVKLSKEIIEAHEGYIEYKSKLKMGTTVTIALPLKKSLS
jgi:signal transduction histidine kinase